MKRVSTRGNIRDPRFSIGHFTYGIPTIREYTAGPKQGGLTIGNFCSISDEVVIFLGGNHRGDWLTTYPFMLYQREWPEARNIQGHPSSKGDVIIRNDVCIGYRAIIMSGVYIGDGAIIGAGAVVTKDVRAYAIVVGNPAREIKRRFPDEVVERLLEIQWWNWHPKTIRKHVSKLCSSDVSWMLGGEDET